MEDFIEKLNLTSRGEIPEKVWRAIGDSFESKGGVRYNKTNLDSISIRFPSYQYSHDYILEIVKKAGFQEKNKVKKSLWRRWLDSITSETDSAFGSRRLDCCSLNRSTQNQNGGRSKYRQ